MRYLEIKSKGNIDPGAFTLIGATTKRGDKTKIGMYGSGNKYAVSAMIRNGIDFRVFSGEKEIKFSTLKQTFRGKEFDLITVDGEKTSLTTDMGGADWDNAFAPIREIYSNALDEDSNATLEETKNFSLEEGYTKFFIELTEEVSHFYENINLYFCKTDPRVLHSNSHGSIYENTETGTTRIFRKGILAFLTKEKKSIYNYNLDYLEINESRVARSQSTIDVNAAYLLKTCTDKNVINNLVLSLTNNNNKYTEHNFYYEASCRFSNSWEEVLRDKTLAPIEYEEMFDTRELSGAYLLPIKLLRPLKTQFPSLKILGLSSKEENSVFVESEPSEVLVNKVIKAVEVLNSTQYKHRFVAPVIKYVKFEDSHTLGMADEGIIYLSVKLDSEDYSKIAKIIIEENEHNKSGFGDETREFQDHLFNLYYESLID